MPITTKAFVKLCFGTEIWGFREVPEMEAEIEPYRYTALQVKCPELLTDWKKT
jgi:hypothetical protein